MISFLAFYMIRYYIYTLYIYTYIYIQYIYIYTIILYYNFLALAHLLKQCKKNRMSTLQLKREKLLKF